MGRFKLILAPGQRPRRNNKFNRKRVFYEGHWFDSKLEASHYQKLLILRRAGKITALEVHKTYPLVINGIAVGKITPDFTFVENGKRVFHECKNPLTKNLTGFRFKVFEALYGVKVEYVMKPRGKFVPLKGYQSTNRWKRANAVALAKASEESPAIDTGRDDDAETNRIGGGGEQEPSRGDRVSSAQEGNDTGDDTA